MLGGYEENLFAVTVASLAVFAILSTRWLIQFTLHRANKWGILDHPGERKRQAQPIPRLGGLSLMPAAWLGCSAALILSGPPEAFALPSTFQSLVGLLVGLVGLFFLGAIDDFKRLSAGQKLGFQVLIAGLAVSFLPVPSSVLGAEVSPAILKALFFGWLVILPNSVNLLDGIDGLTSMLMTAFLAVISCLAIIQSNLVWLAFTVPMMISLVVFLKFNWTPAKIYLGDSGSLALGFVVAYLTLCFSVYHRSPSILEMDPRITFLLSCVWFVDTWLAVGRRFFQRLPSVKVIERRSMLMFLKLMPLAFKNIVEGDFAHIHHKFVRRGFPVSITAVMITTASVAVMAVSVPVSLVRTGYWNTDFLSGMVHAAWAVVLVSFSLTMIFMSYFSLKMLKAQVQSHSRIQVPRTRRFLGFYGETQAFKRQVPLKIVEFKEPEFSPQKTKPGTKDRAQPSA